MGMTGQKRNEVTPVKDKAVIEAIARRDEQAVSAVIDKYSRLLLADCQRGAGEGRVRSGCGGIVADTFIYLWSTRKFDPEKGSLKSWLCIVGEKPRH